MKTDDQTLIEALRILANDVQSDDGVANACIAEGANRLRELKERISKLEDALNVAERALDRALQFKTNQGQDTLVRQALSTIKRAREALKDD